MFIEEIKYNGNESNEVDADLTDLRKMAVSREQQQLIDNISGESGGSGGSGGGDLPTPTVADAGSVVVVDAEGKYVLGEAGGGGLIITQEQHDLNFTLDKNYNEIKAAILNGLNPLICLTTEFQGDISIEFKNIVGIYESSNGYAVKALYYDSETDSTDVWFYIADSATGTLSCTGPMQEDSNN